MKTMLTSMLTLQNQFNEKLDNDWLNADLRWDYALMQEYSEAFAYIPWKWWKHETLNKDQLIMEMVDIFHFGMSMDMNSMRKDKKTIQDIINHLVDNYEELYHVYVLSIDDNYTEYTNSGESLALEDWKIDNIKSLLSSSINDITNANEPFFSCVNFFNIWQLLGLNIEDLYKKYIGKNVLNIFRQDHGYKSGRYMKIWNGLEDNEVLTTIINSLNCDEHLYNNVYQQLEESYKNVLSD